MWDSDVEVIFNLPQLGEGVSLGGRGGSSSSSSSPLPASLPPTAIGWEGAVAAVGAEAVGAPGAARAEVASAQGAATHARGGQRRARGQPQWR